MVVWIVQDMHGVIVKAFQLPTEALEWERRYEPGGDVVRVEVEEIGRFR